jgi:hypothetical protein
MENFPSKVEKKIIYVFPFPPYEDFISKFFYAAFLNHGYKIEYWDVSSLLGYNFVVRNEVPKISWKKIENFKTFREEILADKNSWSIYAVQITRNLNSYRLYKEFSKSGKKTIFFGRGYLPTIQSRRKGIFYYLNKIQHSANAWNLIISKLFLIANQYLLPIKKYEIAFVAGRVAKASHAGNALKICDIHHFDVDSAIRSFGKRPSYLPDRYIVFLDENLPFHPDLINKSITNTNLVDSEKYYEALNKFFSKIENEFNKKIIIAAHPTSDRLVNRYDGRPIYFFRTNLLVRHSDLVLAHGSTAISFAVIYKKSLRLITSSEIMRVNPYYVCNLMDHTARILDIPIWNVDAPFLSNQMTPTSLAGYENYYREFLSDIDREFNSEDIVLEQLEKLLHDFT